MIWSDMFATRGGTSCEQHTRWDRRAGNGARSRFATNIKQLTTPHVANRLKFVLSVVASMLADHPHRPVHRWTLLCLSSRDLGEVLLVALGEVAVVPEASFEC